MIVEKSLLGDDVVPVSEGEAILRSILQTVPDAVIVINERGNIISFSNAAERMFGFAESEIVGENVSMLMTSPDREQHDDHIERYEASGLRRIIGIGRVTTARRRDGSTFPIQLNVGEATTPQGHIFTGFIRDLSETKRAEEQLRDLHSELANVSRISAIGTLASALAHELNQPLTAIANYVESARDMLDTDMHEASILREALSEAASQSLRAGNVVRRLRDFIARGGLEKSTQSLSKLISEANALALLGVGLAEIEVRIDLDADADRIFADRLYIQQVFLNIVRNAVEALKSVSLKQLEITSRAISDELVEIMIADSGEGLSEEATKTLFEPFQTTKEGGLGLGLSICRTIIEGQGGRIWTERSTLGGTAIHFTLMRAKA